MLDNSNHWVYNSRGIKEWWECGRLDSILTKSGSSFFPLLCRNMGSVLNTFPNFQEKLEFDVKSPDFLMLWNVSRTMSRVMVHALQTVQVQQEDHQQMLLKLLHRADLPGDLRGTRSTDPATRRDPSPPSPVSFPYPDILQILWLQTWPATALLESSLEIMRR